MHNLGSFLASIKVSSGIPALFADYMQVCLTRIGYHGLEIEHEDIYMLLVPSSLYKSQLFSQIFNNEST